MRPDAITIADVRRVFAPVDEQAIAARRHALDLEEEGLADTLLVEPLTALAGGIIGGIATVLVLYRLAIPKRRPPQP